MKSGTQMYQSDVDITQKLSAHRIHVERAIRKIRTIVFRPVYLDQSTRYGQCALLTLWQDPVFKKKQLIYRFFFNFMSCSVTHMVA